MNFTFLFARVGTSDVAERLNEIQYAVMWSVYSTMLSTNTWYLLYYFYGFQDCLDLNNAAV